MRRNSLSVGFLGFSLAAYLACLPLIGFCLRPGECDAWPSWKVLTWGALGLAIPQPAHAIWLANPVLLAAWVTNTGLPAVFQTERLPHPLTVDRQE
jgi:hypothetical protein